VSGHVLPLSGSTQEWHGGQVTPRAACVLAPNPSPWTLDGTNTWIIGDTDVVVVDPGPDDPRHLDAVQAHLRERDLRPVGIVLTHGHVDHSEGARTLAEALGVGVRAVDAGFRVGSEGLTTDDVIDLGTDALRVVATPGHSSDSVSLVLENDRSLLSGDTVLGRGTSLVAWPDGDLGEYLDSLTRLRDQAEDVDRVLPGHGPVLQDPGGVLDSYLTHRRARLAEVAEVVESGISEPQAIVAIVYADVPQEVWPAAEMTVRAQLAYLTGTWPAGT